MTSKRCVGTSARSVSFHQLGKSIVTDRTVRIAPNKFTVVARLPLRMSVGQVVLVRGAVGLGSGQIDLPELPERSGCPSGLPLSPEFADEMLTAILGLT